MVNWRKLSPPGMEPEPWLRFTAASLFGCGLFSFFGFLMQMLATREGLFDRVTGELTGNLYGWDFLKVLGKLNQPFFFFAAAMAAFVVLNYLYFFEGSKSIYTMARLKSPWELHIRCWALPLLGAGALLLCRAGMTVLLFLIFLLATPKGVPLPSVYHLIGGLLQ